MLKQTNTNSDNSTPPKQEPIVPDPWSVNPPEPHFPSPLELDRLLRNDHPLLRASATHPLLGRMEVPAGLLAPPHGTLSAVTILLEHELKLPLNRAESVKSHVEVALALLLWEMANPDRITA